MTQIPIIIIIILEKEKGKLVVWKQSCCKVKVPTCCQESKGGDLLEHTESGEL